MPATGSSAALVADIVPGSEGSEPASLTTWNDTLYFTTGNHGLWKSDGTAAGTTLIKDFNQLVSTGPVYNGAMYFEADGGLWKTDGTTAGTVFVKSFLSVSPGMTVNGKLLLRAFGSDGKTGGELWVTDGTTKGTVLVKDIYKGGYWSKHCTKEGGCTRDFVPNNSHPSFLVTLKGAVLFSADDGQNGRELWITDGTAAGTKLVKNIAAGAASSYPGAGTMLNGFYYFGTAVGLWKTDGTAAGTVSVVNVGVDSSVINVGGTLYFASDAGDFWKSDGTTAGTTLVKDIPSWGVMSYWLMNVNDTVFFVANDGVYGQELWKSDGTSDGTVMVKDIAPGSAYAFSIFLSHSKNPWLTNVNGLLYFSASDGQNGENRELWQSDGTAAGTVMVQDIYPGSIGSEPDWLTVMNNTLYFAATDPDHGRELWDPPAVVPGASISGMVFEDQSGDGIGQDDVDIASAVNVGVVETSRSAAAALGFSTTEALLFEHWFTTDGEATWPGNSAFGRGRKKR